jgi:hypothetical protein
MIGAIVEALEVASLAEGAAMKLPLRQDKSRKGG